MTPLSIANRLDEQDGTSKDFAMQCYMSFHRAEERSINQCILHSKALKGFLEDGNSAMPLSPCHNCCSFYARKCECGKCPLLPFGIFVTEEDDKQLVKYILGEWHETMTGLSKSGIYEIVLLLPYINSMGYIQNNTSNELMMYLMISKFQISTTLLR